jgi:hypothetical protein
VPERDGKYWNCGGQEGERSNRERRRQTATG